MAVALAPSINETRFASQDRITMFALFASTYDRLASQTLTTAGLVIKAAASPTVKTGTAAVYATANGVQVTKAGSTDMAALAGTVANATFNVFCFYIDAIGVLSSAMGTAAGILAGVRFPLTPQKKAMLGYIIVNPTGTGNFVGGTTALDDATVIPNVVYINTIGAFDPTATI
jgi:hypothetical protein